MALDYASFITAVEQEAGVPREEADRATRATLETLGERISGGEARDLAERLPRELRPVVVHGEQAEPFGRDEFIRRVAVREGVNDGAAEAHAEAVFAALGRTAGPDEIEEVAAQLPADLRRMLSVAEAHPVGAAPSRVATGDDFADRVVQRAPELDRPGARRAAEAVLEALAERISAGEVEDLEAWLPPDLHAPLQRGNAKSSGAARPLSLDEFLREVADVAGVDEQIARAHARAVFAALRSVVGDDEFRDVFEQVPDEYALILGPRP
jgi:uncharacterized protein (DUF2267 family)